MQKLTKTGIVLAGLMLTVFTLSVLVTSDGQDAPAQEAKAVIPLIPGQLQYPLSAQQQALEHEQNMNAIYWVCQTAPKGTCIHIRLNERHHSFHSLT